MLYLIPAGLEWLHYDPENLWMIAASLPIWLAFFFIGPFWLFYLLQKTTLISRLHVVAQGLIYVGMMFIGAHMVSTLHVAMFPDYRFPLREQFVSAFLWGVFIFAMAHMYLLYFRFVSEQKLRKEAQWINLTNRLNPHFLFNALNTISALIHSSPQKADDVLHKLADMLRYSIEQQKEWVCLAQELAICESYLSIEKSRFTDNLTIHWHLDEDLKTTDYKVPPLLLQPLIENVVKHVSVKPIELIISVKVTSDHLVFEVQDNGSGFSNAVLEGKTQGGHGLDIVRKRVAIAGGTLELSNNGGAVCQINLPVHQCE